MFERADNAKAAEEIIKRLREAQRSQQAGEQTDISGQPMNDDKDALGNEVGVLAPIAAQVVMKLFYCARVARPDLLRAIGHLTRFLTKWSKQ